MTDPVNDDLVGRLEAARAGDRELDYALNEALNDPFWSIRVPANWTTSLDAALALAERLHPGTTWRAEKDDRGFYAAVWSDPDYEPDGCGRGATPALALCIAILKARPTAGTGSHEGEGG